MTEAQSAFMRPGAMSPDRSRPGHWSVPIVAVLASGIAGAVPGIVNFLILPLMQTFHVSRGMALLIFAFGTIGAGVAGPIVGRILTKRSPWVVMLVGAVATSAAYFAASTAPGFISVTIALVVAHVFAVGFCGGLSGQTIVVRTFPDRLGIASGGQIVVAGLAGGALSLIVAPTLIAHGWRTTLAGQAFVILIILPALILVFLRTRAAAVEGDDRAEDAAVVAPPSSVAILSSPAFWLMLLSIEPAALIAGALSANLIPFYTDRGSDLQHASYALAAVAVGSALGAIGVGLLVDRLKPALIVVAISTLALVCTILLTLDLGNPAIWLGLMFLGLGGLGPTLSATVRHYFGEAGYAPAFGMLGPFMILSAFAGAIAGAMRDQFGNYQIVFAVFGAGMLVSLAGALLLLQLKFKPGSGATQA